PKMLWGSSRTGLGISRGGLLACSDMEALRAQRKRDAVDASLGMNEATRHAYRIACERLLDEAFLAIGLRCTGMQRQRHARDGVLELDVLGRSMRRNHLVEIVVQGLRHLVCDVFGYAFVGDEEIIDRSGRHVAALAV